MDHGLFGSLTASGFIPHGHCYLWTPALLAMFVVGDGVIAASYFSIPAALLVLVRKRPDLKFNWIVVMFSLFIFACGTTHLVAIWNIWHADYWLDAWIKVATALVSLATAVALWPLLPKALAVPSVAQLEQSVEALRHEVEERRKAEAEAIAARQAAEVASRAKSEFLSRMSHELRTPLNAVLGFAQLLRLHPQDAETTRTQVQEIERAGWHLLSMIDEILDLARIESGRLALESERIDLGAVISDCVSMTRPVAARDNIRLNNAVPLDAAYVLGDRKRLMQVVSNLLSNAVKYNRRDGSVAVSVATVGDSVRLNIADTGAGLNDEQLARLYQPFERLGAEHGDRPGTGIGLVISKHLVQLMQGTIEVESRPGTGSVFTVVLRAAPQPAIDSHPVPAPQPA